jgi:glucose-6-phosphate isomerase
MSQDKIEIKYKDSVLLDEGEINSVASTLSEYLGTLKKIDEDGGYGHPESFLCLPSNQELFAKNEAMVGEFSNDALKFIIVVGIGGSNLGTQAVYDAIFPRYDAFYSRRPKILFADTNNPHEMSALKKVIDESVHEPKEIVLNVITKSGTTVETVANAMFLLDVLSTKFGEETALSRMVVTTDEDSALWKLAVEKSIRLLPIPKNIGGRYSIFTHAGIFPLRLAGINVSELLAGAVSIKKDLFESTPSQNMALLSAVIDFLIHKKKLNIYNNFFFHPKLESVGKWGRQLLAESLGKKFDKNGNTINAGMTPIVSIGSTDLHSMVQLYLGGPRDKFTNFVYAEGTEEGLISVPNHSPFIMLVPDIVGKDFHKITSSILGGTMEAYKEKAFPYIETVLPRINEHTLGQYFMLKMVETILLGKLWNVNPFDQPEVESYKKVARELLKK